MVRSGLGAALLAGLAGAGIAGACRRTVILLLVGTTMGCGSSLVGDDSGLVPCGGVFFLEVVGLEAATTYELQVILDGDSFTGACDETMCDLQPTGAASWEVIGIRGSTLLSVHILGALDPPEKITVCLAAAGETPGCLDFGPSTPDASCRLPSESRTLEDFS